MDEVLFVAPFHMTPEDVARTFSAFLLGPLIYQNAKDSDGVWLFGPYPASKGVCVKWQLDSSNDYWLSVDYPPAGTPAASLGDRVFSLSHRYHDRKLLQILVTLFELRYGEVK